MNTLSLPLPIPGLRLRPWAIQDTESFQKYAENLEIWRNMRDEFPCPCTHQDAERWIIQALHRADGLYLAIATDQEAIGSISLQIHDDIRRYSGVLSYWVSQPFWGQGIATAAIAGISDYGLGELNLVRIYAKVFSTNLGSIRALAKNGFEQEGYFRKGVYKEGQFVDQVVYAKVV
ncbi:GNAT family N-acetyltransferase [Acaryochloris marina]|uniref:Acetyltransferase n=1 Tax=Acaryochloris marina (strain MBIC 11017) TaxID=329726 RepID=B0BZC5_ACAM1|nr:GNAT family N-acetyltransferase [Acaryochloris marina]ABW29569.1 acetyltransferase [Acaryochloris marina MBIC11017]